MDRKVPRRAGYVRRGRGEDLRCNGMFDGSPPDYRFKARRMLANIISAREQNDFGVSSTVS